MVKIIMHGCNGHMGQVITGLVKEDANAEIIAGIDMNDNGQNDYPVFKSLAECDVPADVVVDFSSYKAADALLDACKEKKLPLVLCTTGLTEDQLKKVQETSKEIPVLRSANMSLGVNTLMKLVQAAAKVLAEAGFDMEIVEKHHKLKCDAPSGPAIALAVVTSIIGVVLLAGGVQGYLLVPANIVERLMLIGGGLCMVMPGSVTDLLGIALAAAVILFQIMKKRRNSIPA